MSAVRPGATLGVLGAGQLGRMFALAAARLGYRVAVLADSPDDPAAQVADRTFLTGTDPCAAAAELAQHCAAVTLEFENVPEPVARAAAERAPLRPGAGALAIAQDRIREKRFLRDAGIPVAPFAVIRDERDARHAASTCTTPLVLKTATAGYDGRGQARVDDPAGLLEAWTTLGARPAVAEAFVDFACEVSVIVARGADGATAVYAPFLNHHARHVLDLTVWPAPGLPPRTSAAATSLAVRIANALELVGVLCVETFVTRDGDVLVNEIAPRPHNSGHVTIEAAATSQFEQQVRAVAGLPLGPVTVRSPAAMANLLGDLFASGEPRWERALREPDVHLHLYGKGTPRTGRKMGHVTVLDAEPERAAQRAAAVRATLRAPADRLVTALP